MTVNNDFGARKAANVKSIRVRVGDNERSFKGRTAWALLRLLQAGEQGCTPVDQPAPRWSAYTLCLRRAGISIETIWEQHCGIFSGRHGRYRITSPVEVIEVQEAA